MMADEWHKNGPQDLVKGISVHQWRLLRGGRLIIMAGTERMEWHQINGNHVFGVFDTINRSRHYHEPLLPN
jgi:hypothetical protein